MTLAMESSDESFTAWQQDRLRGRQRIEINRIRERLGGFRHRVVERGLREGGW